MPGPSEVASMAGDIPVCGPTLMLAGSVIHLLESWSKESGLWWHRVQGAPSSRGRATQISSFTLSISHFQWDTRARSYCRCLLACPLSPSCTPSSSPESAVVLHLNSPLSSTHLSIKCSLKDGALLSSILFIFIWFIAWHALTLCLDCELTGARKDIICFVFFILPHMVPGTIVSINTH